MKTVISSIFSVVVTFLSMPSLAQSFGTDPLAASSASMPQHIPSLVYKNAAAENQLAGNISLDQIPGLGDETNTSLKVKFFRPDSLAMTNSRSNTWIKNDYSSFTLNAPTPTVNGALSFVGTVYQTQFDSTVTKWIQVLSLAATRKINAEFAYSAQINKSSRFDSVIACRLHPANDSGRTAEVVATFQYNFKF